MKGFLIGFLIFLVWASGCIYYIHIKNDTNDGFGYAPPSKAVNKQENNTLPKVEKGQLQLQSLAKEDSLPKNPSKDVDNESSEIALENTSDSLVVSLDDIREADPTFLVDEIKKSIVVNNSFLDTDNTSSISSRIFYPKYKRTDLILDKELIDYAGELKTYLKEYPEKKVTIIGHTDNIGNAQDNFQSGLRKSRQLKWYFTTRRGIKRSKVTATSRGETEPIANNNSASGRKKNNRIEIIID